MGQVPESRSVLESTPKPKHRIRVVAVWQAGRWRSAPRVANRINPLPLRRGARTGDPVGSIRIASCGNDDMHINQKPQCVDERSVTRKKNAGSVAGRSRTSCSWVPPRKRWLAMRKKIAVPSRHPPFRPPRHYTSGKAPPHTVPAAVLEQSARADTATRHRLAFCRRPRLFFEP